MKLSLNTAARTCLSEGDEMPQPKAHKSEIHFLRDGAEKTFAEILRTLDSTAKGAPRLFASGIELINLR